MEENMKYVVNYDDLHLKDWLNANPDVWEQFIKKHKNGKFLALKDRFDACVFYETKSQWGDFIYGVQLHPPLKEKEFGFLDIEQIENRFHSHCLMLIEKAANPASKEQQKQEYITYIELYGVEKLAQVVGENKVRQVLGDYAIYC
jgi:hypothetical protein